MIYLIYYAIIASMIILSVIEAFQESAEDRGAKMRRWPTNLGLALINAAIGLLVPASSVYAAHLAERWGIGLMNMIPTPYFVVFIVSVITMTLATYVIHRIFHEIPFLWRFHQVHHADTSMDSTTAVRHHPVEVVITGFILVAVAMFFGVDPIIALVIAFVDQAWAIWIHSAQHLPQSLHRRVSRVIVTPRIHQSHHSSYVRETNTNYGNTTTIWDQVFGTFLMDPIRPESEFTTGLEQYGPKESARLGFMLKLPFRETKGQTASDFDRAAELRDG